MARFGTRPNKYRSPKKNSNKTNKQKSENYLSQIWSEIQIKQNYIITFYIISAPYQFYTPAANLNDDFSVGSK